VTQQMTAGAVLYGKITADEMSTFRNSDRAGRCAGARACGAQPVERRQSVSPRIPCSMITSAASVRHELAGEPSWRMEIRVKGFRSATRAMAANSRLAVTALRKLQQESVHRLCSQRAYGPNTSGFRSEIVARTCIICGPRGYQMRLAEPLACVLRGPEDRSRPGE